jgi:hypothetical protein
MIEFQAEDPALVKIKEGRRASRIGALRQHGTTAPLVGSSCEEFAAAGGPVSEWPILGAATSGGTFLFRAGNVGLSA